MDIEAILWDDSTKGVFIKQIRDLWVLLGIFHQTQIGMIGETQLLRSGICG